jgi:DNA-binding Xre family transcriptional regulator
MIFVAKFKVVVNLDKLMQKYGVGSLSELSEKTGIRRAALSELANQKRDRIEFAHIEKIADAFGIEDMNEILSLHKINDSQ